MAKNYGKALQFKITLIETEPVVWRTIQVPENYSFYDLHVAITDAMGWEDCHLHEFTVYPKNKEKRARIGIPSDDEVDDLGAGWEIKLRDYFGRNKSCHYTYDFGDGWKHEILFQGAFDCEKTDKYPRCIDGENACPPEDVGGSYGFDNFKRAIADPKHEEHELFIEWTGGGFDHKNFEKNKIKFRNPEITLERILGGSNF